MGLNDNVSKDVIETLENLETQYHTDKIQTLTLLLEKYIHKNKAVHLMDNHDLNNIVSLAKNRMANTSFPKFLKLGSLTKQVPQNNQVHICLIEATIEHVNKLECLKRLPKFDYQENKF